MSQNSKWVPEIMYEEVSDGGSTQLPFIMVPPEEEMPPLLYIFESRETGEFEPGLEGEDVPVVQWDLHQFADMAVLKESLTEQEYDTVRSALGLEPISVAARKGQKITKNIRNNLLPEV
mgnify:CR=1 FL=1|tara:strand:+ start:507 stop:863 length:357 start_codon:yes stop_codon:yes gene_type:complete